MSMGVTLHTSLVGKESIRDNRSLLLFETKGREGGGGAGRGESAKGSTSAKSILLQRRTV